MVYILVNTKIFSLGDNPTHSVGIDCHAGGPHYAVRLTNYFVIIQLLQTWPDVTSFYLFPDFPIYSLLEIFVVVANEQWIEISVD